MRTWKFIAYIDVEEALMFPENHNDINDFVSTMEKEYPDFDSLIFLKKTFQPPSSSLGRSLINLKDRNNEFKYC